jgi:uncharacterized membrane protein
LHLLSKQQTKVRKNWKIKKKQQKKLFFIRNRCPVNPFGVAWFYVVFIAILYYFDKKNLKIVGYYYIISISFKNNSTKINTLKLLFAYFFRPILAFLPLFLC